MNKEPSDHPSFWDPEYGKQPPEFITFDEYIEKVVNPEIIIDAISSLDTEQIEDVFDSVFCRSKCQDQTSDALYSLMNKWYELAIQRGDDEVIVKE